MENAEHPVRCLPPNAQRISVREAVALMWMWEGGLPMPAVAERGSRGDRCVSGSGGLELVFELGGENGRAYPDRVWVKMMVAVVVVVFGDGMLH